MNDDFSPSSSRDGADGRRRPLHGSEPAGPPFPQNTNAADLASGAPPVQFRLVLLSFLAAAIGVAAGVVAFLLYNLIGLFTNIVFFHRFSFVFTSPRHHLLGPWVIVMPVIGGLLVGLMAKFGTSKIRGHGIPEAMEAVLVSRSKIEPKVAILKPISAAIAIGTGGPFGAEGPIIQTGGALGSLVGQVLHTTAAERKVLLACGAAAGMAATFSTPIAAVILAIELLLFEFKSRSFIPLVIATTLATEMHSALMGRGPMFVVAPVDFGIPSALPFYLVLGVICGIAAVTFSRALYWVEDQFEKLPIDDMWWPAIGALGLGIIGYFVPRVFGVGYDTITDILNNNLPLKILLLVMVFKALALLVSLGSGTSGGLLAPMFMASAALGGAYAIGVTHLFPAAAVHPGAFALVAMGAVFGAASRATFTFIVFAFEITGNYNAVLPLMLVSVIADAIALVFNPTSIMTEKLARRGLRIHTDYEPDILQQLSVCDAMARDVPVVAEDMPLTELAERVASHDPELTVRQALPVVDGDNQLVGIITRADLLRAIGQLDGLEAASRIEAGDPRGLEAAELAGPGASRAFTVGDACSRNLVVVYPDEVLGEAAEKMLRHHVGRLPVVDRANPRKLVGYVGRAEILGARLRRIEEERVREPGWAGRFFKGA